MIEKKDIAQPASLPLYQRLSNRIIELIEEGKLKKNDQLPSVNVLCAELGVARVTVVNSYAFLRNKGIIEARHGKGYFVSRETDLQIRKVFLLFDAMNGYKEILYQSFLSALGEAYSVDIYFHYYNLRQFSRFIENNLGDYNHYVVLPHFNTDVSGILRKIPENQLLLMDNDVAGLPSCPAVYQDFSKDVESAFRSAGHLLSKYRHIHLVTGTGFQFIPQGITDGFKKACRELRLKHSLTREVNPIKVKSGEAYLVFTDHDLVSLVEQAMKKKLKPGRDLGIISYDDTPLKGILAGGITTISTDFVSMGKTAARMIRENLRGKFPNPSGIILRKSL